MSQESKDVSLETVKEPTPTLSPQPLDHIELAKKKLYHTLELLLVGLAFTARDVVSTTLKLMQTVERDFQLRGLEKRQIVISVLTLYVDNNRESIPEYDVVRSIITNTLPSTIDTMVGLERADLSIKFDTSGCSCFGGGQRPARRRHHH